jgi:hypothetical protein
MGGEGTPRSNRRDHARVMMDVAHEGLDAWQRDTLPREQVGKTESCSTCGLCWRTRHRIVFLQH